MTVTISTNDQPNSQPQPKPARLRSPLWRRGAIAVSLVGGGFMMGAVTLASAGGMPWQGEHHGPRVGMIQHMVRNALENVGASTAQENKIHDIIAATYTGLDQGKTDREALRKQVLDIMRAPTIDRAAVEKLRADQVAAMDAKSKTIVGAALDAAGQLTPEQRAKLVQHMEDRMAHGGWGGWRHGGPEGGPDGGPAGGRGHEGHPDRAQGDHG